MAANEITVSPTYNGDSVSLTAGMIVRLKPGANNNVVRAQADSAPHVQGVNAVVISGASAPTGSVVLACVGRETVQMESGLTPNVGDTVYVSPNVAGKGTNVLPSEVSAIGTIADVSNYARLGTVEVDVNISAVIPANVSGVSSVSTTKPGDSVSPSTGAVVIAGGGLAVVANLTALAALDAANFPVGNTLTFVTSRRAFFSLETSALATNLIDVVAASGLVGAQWLRLRVPNLANIAQTAYSVDELNVSTTASDDNTGLDDAHALLTAAELSYRVEGARYGAGVCCTVRNLSQMSNAFFNVRGIAAGAAPAGGPNSLFPSSFAIVGVRTVLYTGTIGTPSQVSAGGNGVNHFTDAGAPAFATANRIWERTNGTKAQFWPQKDETGGVWRVSQPSTNFSQATLANGDTYTISSMPTINNLKFPMGNSQKQIQIAFCYETTTPSVGDCNPELLWICCQFSQSNNYTGAFYNCAEFERNFANSSMSPQVLIGGGLIRNACNIPAGSIVNSAVTAQYVSIQGGAITIDFGARMVESNLMFFDETGACVTVATANSSGYFNSFGGFGCSGKIVNVAGRGCSAIFKSSALPPAGMTTDANPYEINGVSIATPTSPGNVDTTVLSQVNAQ